jgi:predicted amidophosphoribosyltransferase
VTERLEFAAPFQYASRGASPIAQKSRELRDRIKRGDTVLYGQIARHVLELVRVGVFPDFFGPQVTVVPVPGHAPMTGGAQSRTAQMAQSLLDVGLAGSVSQLVSRRVTVPKSAWANPADRPRALDHVSSLDARLPLTAVGQVLLLDDVITRGATLMGVAVRLRQLAPTLVVRAFALLRAITDGDIEAIRAPTVGYVELDELGETWRRP